LASQYLNAESGLTLTEAVTRALAQEPTLRATRTALDAADGERVQADLRPNPTVSFMQQLEPGGTDSQSRIEMQWPLELFRKTGRVAVAEQGRQATQWGVSDRERLLVGDVRMKYGEVVAEVRDLSVNDELIATVTRQVELLRARGAGCDSASNEISWKSSCAGSRPSGFASGRHRVVIELKRLLYASERFAPTARFTRTACADENWTCRGRRTRPRRRVGPMFGGGSANSPRLKPEWTARSGTAATI
jgi:cobalt-zinc-cadmium efflux system outer membrane protein